MFCFTSDFSAFSWHVYSYSKTAALKVLVVRLWWVAFQIPPLCFCFRAAPHAEPWRRGKQLLTRAFSKLVVNIPGGTLTVAPFTIHNYIIISCMDSTSQEYKDMTASPICSLALIYTIFKQLHFSLYSYFLLTLIAWCNFDSTRCLIESVLDSLPSSQQGIPIRQHAALIRLSGPGHHCVCHPGSFAYVLATKGLGATSIALT